MRERAEVLDAYGWELYNAHRFREAVAAGLEATRLYEEVGDPVALGECLVRVSRHLFMTGDTDEAEHSAERAVTILEPTGHGPALAHASLYEGAILAMTDEPERAAAILAAARELAIREGRLDLAALALNYLGIARVELGDPDGLRAAAGERRRGDRRAPVRVRRARLLQPGRAARPRRASRRARDVRARRAALRPRARVLVARLQPRAAPLRRRWSGAAAGSPRWPA